jgi:hypothetical protein
MRGRTHKVFGAQKNRHRFNAGMVIQNLFSGLYFFYCLCCYHRCRCLGCLQASSGFCCLCYIFSSFLHPFIYNPSYFPSISSFYSCELFYKALLNLSVDCSERRFAFRGAFCEPPRRLLLLRGLASTLIPALKHLFIKRQKKMLPIGSE